MKGGICRDWITWLTRPAVRAHAKADWPSPNPLSNHHSISFNIFHLQSPLMSSYAIATCCFMFHTPFTSTSVSVFISKTDSLLLSKYALALDEYWLLCSTRRQATRARSHIRKSGTDSSSVSRVFLSRSLSLASRT